MVLEEKEGGVYLRLRVLASHSGCLIKRREEIGLFVESEERGERGVKEGEREGGEKENRICTTEISQCQKKD